MSIKISNYSETETCVTQAYPQELAGMLNELWPSSIASSLHFMSWSSTKAIFADGESYAQSFAQLMKAQLTPCEGMETDQRAYKNLSIEIQRQQPDMIIFHSPIRLLPIWLMPSSAENQLLKQIPVSLLVTRGPRWPLRKILLVLRASKFDATAMAWAIQIASKSSAEVTALPTLAPVPPLFAGITLEQRSLIHLLSSNCPLGKMLRQISLYFEEQNIQGTLHLQGGTIVDQLRQEIDEYDYDLVIVAADTDCSIIQRMMGERVNPLLSLAEVPILIAKPVQPLKGQGNLNPV